MASDLRDLRVVNSTSKSTWFRLCGTSLPYNRITGVLQLSSKNFRGTHAITNPVLGLRLRILDLPVEETTRRSGIMKRQAVDFALALLLLADLLQGLAISKTHPDKLLRWKNAQQSGSRHAAQRTHSSSLPRYMIHLYRVMLTEGRSNSPADSVGKHWKEENLHSSDSVVSLVAKSCQQIGRRWSLTFDMSSMSASDTVQLAELRIRLPAFTESSSATVDIYHSHSECCTHCPENRLLLGHLRAHSSPVASTSSWNVFNVTEMLRCWLQHQEHSSKRMLEEDEAEPDEQVQGDEGIEHPTADRVMMVVFLKHEEKAEQVPTLIHTAKHSKYAGLGWEHEASRMRKGREKRHQQSQQQREEVTRDALIDKSAQEENKDLCRKVDMWVDLEKLGWSEWIVHPKQYNAYRCAGTCPAPVDEIFTPSNHAYMQSLLNYHHPDKAPCLSCVPTRLLPLSMLYFEDGKVVMRHHDDMVVEECGCH